MNQWSILRAGIEYGSFRSEEFTACFLPPQAGENTDHDLFGSAAPIGQKGVAISLFF